MTDLKAIIRPVLTEKSTTQNTLNKFVFEVKRSSTKEEIKKAFEAIYGVKPKTLRTQIVTKKVRLIGRNRILTKRPVNKRAIITLEKGKTIDPNKIAK